jgi:hypothetical protein
VERHRAHSLRARTNPHKGDHPPGRARHTRSVSHPQILTSQTPDGLVCRKSRVITSSIAVAVFWSGKPLELLSAVTTGELIRSLIAASRPRRWTEYAGVPRSLLGGQRLGRRFAHRVQSMFCDCYWLGCSPALFDTVANSGGDPEVSSFTGDRRERGVRCAGLA